MNNKGQGTVWFWMSSMVGIMVIIITYIVFDSVLFADTNSLEAALIPMGLNVSSTPYTALVKSWDIWPIALVFSWILAMIVRSIIKEPGYGY